LPILGEIPATPILPKALVFDAMGYEVYADEVKAFHDSEAAIRIVTAPARTSKSYAAAPETVCVALPHEPLLGSLQWLVGTTYDTPYFAVDAVEKWWRTEGQQRYRNARHLAILADGGGSNGSSSRVWKYGLQTRVCDRHSLNVTVAHYPSGASKWNPIEHRLFSEISKNWAARPLDSYETILKYLRTTTTTTGLRVRAHLVRKAYKKGVKITREQMDELDLTNDEALPKWNYTLQPA